MNDVTKNILNQCEDAAKAMLKKEAKAFMKDASLFVDRTKDDLKKWAIQFKQGEIDADDLKYLLDMKKDVAEMQALKRTGIAKIRLEELQDQMLSIVVSSISSAI
jgi:O-phosphoseryl-tRNA(Cys) synthetase